jgi:hypothetical protein
MGHFASAGAYEDAFKRHYPEKEVRVLYRSREDRYAVFIDGHAGERRLTHEELIEATRMFNR